MFRIFTKIRKDMLKQNNFTKYLLYAIGEIVLVVIGILIALNINNWNGERKESKLELEILVGLSENVSNNTNMIKAMIRTDSMITVRNRVLLEVLQDPDAEYHDSLEVHFGGINRYDVFFPQRIAYETLRSKGFQIIKNDSIRNMIIELFDETYLLNTHITELKKDIHINSNPVLTKRLFTLESIGRKTPVDFSALKNDTEFINTLAHITAENENFLTYSQIILERNIKVEEVLEREIRKRNNLVE